MDRPGAAADAPASEEASDIRDLATENAVARWSRDRAAKLAAAEGSEGNDDDDDDGGGGGGDDDVDDDVGDSDDDHLATM